MKLAEDQVEDRRKDIEALNVEIRELNDDRNLEVQKNKDKQQIIDDMQKVINEFHRERKMNNELIDKWKEKHRVTMSQLDKSKLDYENLHKEKEKISKDYKKMLSTIKSDRESLQELITDFEDKRGTAVRK